MPLWEGRARLGARSRDSVYRRALLGADLLASLAVVGLQAWVFHSTGPGASALVLLAVVPAVNTATGLYKRDELVLSKSTLDEAPSVFRAATLAALLASLIESALVQTPIGARELATAWLGLTVLVLAFRVLARGAAQRLVDEERCLIVGDRDSAERVAAKLSAGRHVKAVPIGRLVPGTVSRDAWLAETGIPDAFARAVRERDVHRLIVAGAPDGDDGALQTIAAAKAAGLRVSVVPRMLEVIGSSVAFDYVDGLTLLGVQRFGLSRASRRCKRAFDVAGSAVGLIASLPLWVLIAAAIKLNSRGPVLFRQSRIGRDGLAFSMFKFRSMYDGADARKRDLHARNEAGPGLFKITDDPRITRVGRILRRTALDEVPQLLNVLRGQMSLVGPRPLVVEDDSQIHGWHRQRLQLTPGMTGPWQVLGSARIPLAEMVTLDYLYIANWSLWEDVKILLRTGGFILARRGR